MLKYLNHYLSSTGPEAPRALWNSEKPGQGRAGRRGCEDIEKAFPGWSNQSLCFFRGSKMICGQRVLSVNFQERWDVHRSSPRGVRKSLSGRVTGKIPASWTGRKVRSVVFPWRTSLRKSWGEYSLCVDPEMASTAQGTNGVRPRKGYL